MEPKLVDLCLHAVLVDMRDSQAFPQSAPIAQLRELFLCLGFVGRIRTYDGGYKRLC